MLEDLHPDDLPEVSPISCDHLILTAMQALGELMLDRDPGIRLEAAQTVLDHFLATESEVKNGSV